MIFGLYAPIPMATVGSPEAVQAHEEALFPLQAGHRDKQYDLSHDLLLTADRAGFDLCLFAERHLGTDLAAWVLASAIAAQCERMRALVAVHPGLVDPVMIAKLSVSLDRISKGRMALNLVNGWYDEEFRMFGGTVLADDARYKRAGEFIDILRGLWTQDTFTLHGEHFTVDQARLLLKPATPTPPEIFSVSAGDKGRDFIAQYCDWWFINYPKAAETPDDVLRGIEACISDMERRSQRFGRKIRFGMNPFVALGESEEEAIESAIQRIFATDPAPDVRKIKLRMMPATKAGLMGPTKQVRAQMRRFGDMGLELILCKMIPTPQNIRRIGEDVLAYCH
jgi:FMNH2-dependent dimethyl sulfone monooxygenase